MSKHETWRTRQYWNRVGGTLIEEFIAVKGSKQQGKRPLDAVIILGEKKEIHPGNYTDIKDKDVIVVQTKRGRLGMYLLGQAFFSRELLLSHGPNSVKSVAVCGRGDDVMQKLADKFEIEVVIIPEEKKEPEGSSL